MPCDARPGWLAPGGQVIDIRALDEKAEFLIVSPEGLRSQVLRHHA